MALEPAPMTMYTAPAQHEPLPWTWVEDELTTNGLYWVMVTGEDPHPRPVWGVWVDGRLLLSIGTPTIKRVMAGDATVVVHLESATDVVVVTGSGALDDDPATVEAFVAAYDAKYDWQYDASTYGPPTAITPTEIVAWRAAGEHGRDGFTHSGKWVTRG